ncbi:MAG: ABC transporter ATP-binding protein [Promethearchaeota archaeon]
MLREHSILFRYLTKYKFFIALNVVLAIFMNVFNLILPRLLQRLIDDVLLNPSVTQDEALLAASLLDLFKWTLLIFFASGMFGFARTLVNTHVGNNIIYEMRNDIFRALQNQSYSFFDQYRTGDLMSKATGDVTVVKNFLTNQVANFIRSVAVLVVILFFVFSMNWVLSLVFLSLTPPMFVLMRWYRKRIRPTFYQMRKQYGTLHSVLQENVVGVRVIRAFGRQAHEREKFERENEEFLRENEKVVKLSSLYGPANDLITQGGSVVLIFIGALLVYSGAMQLGEVVGFYVYYMFVFDPVRQITNFFSQLAQNMAAADRIMEILDYRSEIEVDPDAEVLEEIKGEVTFEDVWFKYKGEKRYALKGISFTVKPGETVAILGATGSGKTTVVNLIPRFYDPTRGRILIDGKDVRKVELKSLRRQIGIVAQEVFLFSRSIEENIAYGNRKVKREDVERVAKIANIHDFIMTLPKKYKTVIGERGVTLSGGQKQRVAIARALLLRPRILILDDSTSSVDVDTEYAIQRELSKLFHTCTTFIITQRLSTIRNADRIFIMDQGEIVERGTHEELVKLGGIYARIYKTLYRSELRKEEARAEGVPSA